jgi:hypothetical protein
MENSIMSLKKKSPEPQRATQNNGVVNAYIATSSNDRPRSSSAETAKAKKLPAQPLPDQAGPSSHGTKVKRSTRKPVVTSAIVFDASELAFSIKLRNLIEYSFECYNDIAYNLVDMALVLPHLTKSVIEMKTLNLQSHVYLDEETERYFVEFIDETDALLQEEAVALPDPEEASIRYFRHFVRVSWLTQCLLKYIDSFGKALAQEEHNELSA